MSEKQDNSVNQDKNIKAGMTVQVHEKIKDIDSKGKEKERIQVFEGIVLAVKKPNTPSATITVRKKSGKYAVEKIFPLHSPLVEKIIPVKQAKVRRAKLYYLRNSKKRLKEKKI